MAAKTVEELEKELKALQNKPKDTTDPLDLEAFPITVEERARYVNSRSDNTLEGFIKHMRQIDGFIEATIGKGNRFGTVNGRMCVINPEGEVIE